MEKYFFSFTPLIIVDSLYISSSFVLCVDVKYLINLINALSPLKYRDCKKNRCTGAIIHFVCTSNGSKRLKL